MLLKRDIQTAATLDKRLVAAISKVAVDSSSLTIYHHLLFFVTA